MKRIIYIIFPLLLIFPIFLSAATLEKLTRVDLPDSIQLFLSFDSTPQYTTRENGKRLDLIFSKTRAGETLHLFSPDDRVVKILSQNNNGKLILSLFFRYPLQKQHLRESEKNRLVLEVLLGNKYSHSYETLADRLKGLTLLDRSAVDLSNPFVRSPYKNDWWSFFSTYESPVTISVPVKFTLPPFPLIAFLPPEKSAHLSLFSDEIIDAAAAGNWEQVKSYLLNQLKSPSNEEAKKLLALTLGEVLARNGEFENSFKQLYLLKQSYPDELLSTYARFLLGYLQAVYQSPYLANYDLPQLEPTLPSGSELKPYLQLLEIEVSLASSDFKKLNSQLQRDDITYPKPLQDRVMVRQADYWYAIQQPVKAFASYRLLQSTDALKTQPYSKNGFCNTLYQLKKYKNSADCYDELSAMIRDNNLLGMINYRKYMAQLRFTPLDSMQNSFKHLENAFPGQEVGLRATLKSTDIELLKTRDPNDDVSRAYHRIADQAVNRSVREEALFKEALTYSLRGEAASAIDLLHKLLRQFSVGNLQESTQALLISLLPIEIKRLADNKEYFKALVLAKQNRVLFQNNWIKSTFLEDIANAYSKVGLYDESEKLYLYLIGIVPLDKREQYYLPMIIAAFEQGKYSLVDDYCAQYHYNYPNGSFSKEILYYRLQALAASERLQEAIELLPSPIPRHKGIIELAALLYYRTDQFSKCLEVINRLESGNLSQRDTFIKAECLFHKKQDTEAKQLFAQIPGDSPYSNYALYRRAELAKKEGEIEKSLSFLKKIVETGKNDNWKQLAERELQIRDTIQQIPLLKQP